MELLSKLAVAVAAGAVLVQPAMVSGGQAPPVSTVAVSECGTNWQLVAGSSPYQGTVMPGSGTLSCEISFVPSPFRAIVDGSTNDFVAPICTTQIDGARVKWTVQLTAAGISFAWDENLSVSDALPPGWISWICQYPWTPSAS
jgi:hypothetical protein